MYKETLDHFVSAAITKTSWLKRSPAAFAIGAVMAGAYVGLGVILMFSVAGPLDPSIQTLVMSLSFGVALTLVVFAGSELFTGHTMSMTMGLLHHKTTLQDLALVWSVSWFFNLVGSVALAHLYFIGGGAILEQAAPLLNEIAAYKMNSSSIELVVRAILCNWLVCLALWMAARCRSDSGKAIVIFWCLFAFIGSGYEHSIANMTLLSLALLGEHPATISLTGMFHNLAWVTIGNIIGGVLFMGIGYWLASGNQGSVEDKVSN